MASEAGGPPTQSHRALWRSLGLLQGNRRLLALTFVLTALVVVANLVIPTLFGDAVGAIEDEDESLIIRLGLAIIGVGIIRAAVVAWQTLATGRLGIDVERRLRDEVHDRYLELDDEYLGGQRVGQMVSRIMVTSGPIRTFLSQSLAGIASDLLTVLFAAIAMVVVDARLAVAAFWPVPIVIWLVVRFGRKATPVMVGRQEAEADLTASAEETLDGLVTVELLGAGDRRQADFDAETERWLAAATRVVDLDVRYDAAIVNLPNLAWAGLFTWGGITVIDGGLALGDLVTFLAYVGILLGPIQHLGSTLWRFQNATASAQRVFEVLDRVPAVASAPGASVLVDPDPRGEGGARSKSYGGSRRALDDVEMSIDAGTNLGLVGPTGSGKSALVRALARVYDPESGDVRMGGHRLVDIDVGSLRAYVRLLGPTPHLFTGTVFDNVRYGRPDATLDDVVAVTEALGVHDRIVALADGYDTSIGPGGAAISGPTAQTICIARALVTAPRLLLLDDVTATLPPEVQGRVVAGIAALTADTTVVSVVNRPAVLALCDRIAVMVDGEIVAMGAVADLVDDPAFAGIAASWGVGGSNP